MCNNFVCDDQVKQQAALTKWGEIIQVKGFFLFLQNYKLYDKSNHEVCSHRCDT